MRKFKFRAWDTWQKIDEDMPTAMVEETHRVMIKLNGIVYNSEYGDDQPTRYKIMQFTGLKDKNGVEIYEGDIIQIYAEQVRFDGSIQEFRSSVFFNDGSFSYTHDDGYSYPLDAVCSESGIKHEGSHFCEVIGNIYENPQLLEQK